VPRIKPDSGGIKMIMPPWSGVVSGFTLLLEALLLTMCKHMPIHQVGKLMGTIITPINKTTCLRRVSPPYKGRGLKRHGKKYEEITAYGRI
jgi:hypothetical protein